MKTITAGECVKISIKAKDDQSGIQSAEIEAVNLRDLPGSPAFDTQQKLDWPADTDEVVFCLEIPEYIPDSKWKINSIILVNGTGRSIKYSPGKDFEPLLFQVKAKTGVDLTPAELISVQLID